MKRKATQGAAFFVLGFLMGCVFYNLQAGHLFDQLHQKRIELETKLAAAETRLARLEGTLTPSNEAVIREVEVRVSCSLNSGVKNQIRKEIEDWLGLFIGRPLDSLDPEAIPFIVHQRTLNINGRTLVLLAENTIISERLLMYVRAVPEQDPLTTN
ncbi:MAG: hypothetical protein GX062_07930 [Firmicutes bacterium]|nr:hypothetical protein [Bacillota bacterium]